jgi:hydroxymethylbilane synthase
VGVFAKITNSDIIITGFVSDVEGREFLRKEIQGPCTDSAQLADSLADELIEAGAAELLESMEQE